MAFRISIDTDFGVAATYWKIARVQDHFHGTLEVVMQGYASHASRLAAKQPLATETVWLRGVEKPRADLYLLLRQLPQYQGAEDV